MYWWGTSQGTITFFCWQFYFESQTKIRFELIKTKTNLMKFRTSAIMLLNSCSFPPLNVFHLLASLDKIRDILKLQIWSFSKRNIVWILSKPLHFWLVLKSISKSATFFLLWKKENASSPGPKIPKTKFYSGLSSLFCYCIYCSKHCTLIFQIGQSRQGFIVNMLLESSVYFFSLFTGFFFALIVYNLSISPSKVGSKNIDCLHKWNLADNR